MSSRIVSIALASAAIIAGASSAEAQSRQPVRAGTLTCDVSAGVGLIVTSARSLSCRYVPRRGRAEAYTGTVRRFGLDVGATNRARLVWAVYTSSRRLQLGVLEGNYVGGSAEGTIGVGGGVNVLVGGSNNTVSLQPVSVQAQTGLNIAAGVSEFTLDYVRR